MRFVWNTAVKDWRQHARDPLGILVWIGIPLLIGALMTMVSGGKEGTRPQAHLLVADQDSSFVSGLLLGALNQGAGGGLISTERVERPDGIARMDEGDASALLTIPRGFGQAVLLEEPMALELVTNPSQRVLPGIVEETFSILVDGTFYLQRLIGEDLRGFGSETPDGANPSNERIAEFSIKVNLLIAKIRGYLFPPVIDLQVVSDKEDTAEDDVSIGLLFLPGILFMSLLFLSQGISMDFWRERNLKTLRRVVVTPQNIVWFSLGKVLSAAGVMFVVAVISLTLGYWYFGLDLKTLPLAAVWTVLSGALLMTMMMVLQLHAGSQRAAGIMSMALMFPLMMVGGSFFPFEAMPGWMVSIGQLTPNGWALKELKAIMLGPFDGGSLLVSFIGVVIAASLLFALGARRLGHGFAQG